MAFDQNAFDALLGRARVNLSLEASPETAQRIKERLESVAAELALEWLTGDRRFESQGQQAEYWLNRLYETLYEDEQPDGSKIYARFALPLPRAQYLTRLLIARRSAQWRRAARTEAEQALRAVETKAREQVQKKNLATNIERPMSRGALDELMILYDAALSAAGGATFSPPRRQSASPSRIFVALTAETICAILDHISQTGN